MHSCRIHAFEVGPLSFDVKVAWHQGNNIGIEKFFYRGHLKIVMAKKQIWNIFLLWAKNNYKSLLGVSKT